MKTIRTIGEFGFIERIDQNIPFEHKGVIKGIGDDAAVLSYNRTHDMLMTTDMLIEGVHFTRNTPLDLVGRKAVNVSLSDIAAMAGVPAYATISLGLPKTLSLTHSDALIKGVKDALHRFKVSLVGGDTNASGSLVIESTVIGFVTKGGSPLRAHAKPGDGIYVTGPLGGSYASGHHLQFVPRVREAGLIAKYLPLHAMIDVSDGLANDLFHILTQSQVGAVLYEASIPLRNRKVCIENALYDGEDFELLCTIGDVSEVKGVVTRLAKQGTSLMCIGHITNQPETLVLQNKKGAMCAVPLRGWRHF